MTALGLAVAIPAVLGYNALVRGNKSIIDQAQPLCVTTCMPTFVTGATALAQRRWTAQASLPLKKA
jgi:biopolymer transport protein ExbB